jgi:hypothetical protein
MMEKRDYMAEHKRLINVLKAAKTPAAAREMRRQKAEVHNVMSRPKGMKMRDGDPLMRR